MAAIPPALSVLHYVLLPYTGRVGLLGLGTAAWLMAALVLMARADQSARRMAQLHRRFPHGFHTACQSGGVGGTSPALRHKR